MTSPPIPYQDARDTVAWWLHQIERAGPPAFECRREVYAEKVTDLHKTQELLQAIVDHKRKQDVSRETRQASERSS